MERWTDRCIYFKPVDTLSLFHFKYVHSKLILCFLFYCIYLLLLLLNSLTLPSLYTSLCNWFAISSYLRRHFIVLSISFFILPSLFSILYSQFLFVGQKPLISPFPIWIPLSLLITFVSTDGFWWKFCGWKTLSLFHILCAFRPNYHIMQNVS